MFDRGVVYRLVDPPVAVLVDLSAVWPPTRVRWGAQTPLWVRAGGVDLAPANGELSGWMLTCAGDWLAEVTMTLRARNGAVLDDRVRQFVPATAVRPLEAR